MAIKTLKPKNCKECGGEFTPWNSSLQRTCSVACAIAEGVKKAAEQKEKKARVEKAAMKERIMTLSDHKDKLQIEINTIVRWIDGTFRIDGARTGKIDAGHYISRGSNDTIRFNLHNIHNQSMQSNRYKAGDTIKYQEGLKRFYGLEYFEYVESLRQTKPIQLKIWEIKEKVIIARLIIRELKELGNTYNARERVDLRNEYNFRIGIYSQNRNL